MRRLACALAGLLPLLTAAGAAPPPAPATFSLDPQRLAAAQARVLAGDTALQPALGRLRRDADKLLGQRPQSVMDKAKVPPSGDKHDYLSLGPYFWPDPAKPDGLPWINRDGETNPETKVGTDSGPLGQTCSAVGTLSLAWYFTANDAYAAKAVELLRVWFLDEATRMNPNLTYGQGIPGRTAGRGIGLIDTHVMIAVADASGLLDGAKAWTPELRAGLKAWFTAFAGWMQTSKNGQDEAKSKNNHGTWYHAQLAAYALAAGDREVARRAVEFGRKLIASQIEPDGRQPLELARTKSYSYTEFNLSAYFTLAELARRVDVDLWGYRTEDGRCIRAALDYLAPYLADATAWQGKQIQPVKQPDETLAGLLRRAALVYAAAQYEAKLLPLAQDLAPARWQLLWPAPPAVGPPA